MTRHDPKGVPRAGASDAATPAVDAEPVDGAAASTSGSTGGTGYKLAMPRNLWYEAVQRVDY